MSALCSTQVHRRLGPITRNSALQGFNLICIDPIAQFISSIIWNMICIKVEIKGKHNFASWNVSLNIINNESLYFLHIFKNCYKLNLHSLLQTFATIFKLNFLNSINYSESTILTMGVLALVSAYIGNRSLEPQPT